MLEYRLSIKECCPLCTQGCLFCVLVLCLLLIQAKHKGMLSTVHTRLSVLCARLVSSANARTKLGMTDE